MNYTSRSVPGPDALDEQAVGPVATQIRGLTRLVLLQQLSRLLIDLAALPKRQQPTTFIWDGSDYLGEMNS